MSHLYESDAPDQTENPYQNVRPSGSRFLQNEPVERLLVRIVYRPTRGDPLFQGCLEKGTYVFFSTEDKEQTMSEKTLKAHGKTKSVSRKGTTKAKDGAEFSPPKGSARTRRKRSPAIPPEDRYRMIAEAAYFIAERRGFADGRCEEDWYEAERIVMNDLLPIKENYL